MPNTRHLLPILAMFSLSFPACNPGMLGDGSQSENSARPNATEMEALSDPQTAACIMDSNQDGAVDLGDLSDFGEQHGLSCTEIALVDDDMRNSFAMSKGLREQGLEVVMADNGQMALDRLDKDKEIDLVLMDIMMPVMDGYETMHRIRKRKQHKDLPIVALTAKAMVEDRAKCIKAGANDYLAKPVDMERLVSLMRVLLCK